MKKDNLSLLNAIAQTIFDKKGINILALDVRKFSSLTDFVIIAEGNVDRHVIAIEAAIEEELKKEGVRPVHIEGVQVGDWVVMDYLNIMVHLFTPGIRERYNLEQLWKEGEIVDLTIDTSAKASTNF